MLEWCEDSGMTPLLAMNAEKDGVQVPAGYVENGRITLNVSYSAMRDREITNESLTGYARFGGRSEYLVLPMYAVEALVIRETGEGMVFPDDDDDTSNPVTSVIPGLHIVGHADVESASDSQSSDADQPDGDGPDDVPPRPPRGRPNLKVVK